MRAGTGKPRRTNSVRFGLTSLEINNRPNHKNLISNPATDGIVRYPSELISFNVPHKKTERFHPTQKPIELFKYLIKTYTNENALVLDCFAGSGTTALAAIDTKRNFICIEKDMKYCEIIKDRVENKNQQL